MRLKRPPPPPRAQHLGVKSTPLGFQSGVQLTLNICWGPQAELSYCRIDPCRSVFIRGLLFAYLRSSAFICG